MVHVILAGSVTAGRVVETREIHDWHGEKKDGWENRGVYIPAENPESVSPSGYTMLNTQTWTQR